MVKLRPSRSYRFGTRWYNIYSTLRETFCNHYYCKIEKSCTRFESAQRRRTKIINDSVVSFQSDIRCLKLIENFLRRDDAASFYSRGSRPIAYRALTRIAKTKYDLRRTSSTLQQMSADDCYIRTTMTATSIRGRRRRFADVSNRRTGLYRKRRKKAHACRCSSTNQSVTDDCRRK